MEKVEFLLRRFRQIAPVPLEGRAPAASRELACWLRDDVGPALAGLVARPAFQRQASWPLRALAPGAGTPERGRVDEVDAALVGCAGAVCRLDGPPCRQGPLADVAALRQARQIAGRFWADLVCPDDYFEPHGGWMERCPGGGQPGEFVLALSPELRAGGDLVSRCLLLRAEGLAGSLQDALGALADARQAAGSPPPPGWLEACEQHRRLRAAVAGLRQACLAGPDQPLRDACALLTRAHAALHPGPDLAWLGLPPEAALRGQASMGHRLRRCDGELLERLAAALGEVRRLYPPRDGLAAPLDEAVASGGLVLVRQPPRVFWQGKAVEVTWSRHPALWQFWRLLVEKGRRGQPVEERDLSDEPLARSNLANRLSRLRKLLPATLWGRVEPSRDPRGYRLDLERGQVYVF